MLLASLLEQLQDMTKAHPELLEAQVWAHSEEAGFKFQVKGIGFDKKLKTARVKLYD